MKPNKKTSPPINNKSNNTLIESFLKYRRIKGMLLFIQQTGFDTTGQQQLTFALIGLHECLLQ
jgi:hypothetical protein